jgi:K+-transporting ATPase ATPase B chain
MNSGTQAAKEAGNMVDLDNDPQVNEIIEIGKQLLMTRGTLTTFSIANDVAKFCHCSSAFITAIPALEGLNIMGLQSRKCDFISCDFQCDYHSDIDSALKGVDYKPSGECYFKKKPIDLWSWWIDYSFYQIK